MNIFFESGIKFYEKKIVKKNLSINLQNKIFQNLNFQKTKEFQLNTNISKKK